ncbi:hypothetical protein [Streptomyces cucumeris]|uniref:hypothetical protein n=1 Tax=Streptomyces cucumeris TaxID=2962890 RepID=UPI0020C8A8AE|nr:hypothetical protein [Streptomyces sp. NEAU-Y11]MCP9212737.1 hypothetical protein [Streptomyces sp. NEAU-Y11]
MSTFKVDRLLQQLVTALDRLTWHADEQLSYVHDLGVDVDELALEFDDIHHLAIGKAQEGLISDALITTIQPVDEHLKLMTEMGPSMWTEAAVQDATEWQELRNLARSARSHLAT